MIRKLMLLLWLFFIFSCSQNKNETIPFNQDEYAIYSNVVDSLYFQESVTASDIKELAKKNKNIHTSWVDHHYILLDSTWSWDVDIACKRLKFKGINSDDLLINFKKVNERNYSLKDFPKAYTNISLISYKSYSEYFKKYKKDGFYDTIKGLEEFQKDYPHNLSTEIIKVTRVGFSSDKNYAIVGMENMYGCERGFDFCFLERENNKWVIKKILNHFELVSQVKI